MNHQDNVRDYFVSLGYPARDFETLPLDILAELSQEASNLNLPAPELYVERAYVPTKEELREVTQV